MSLGLYRIPRNLLGSGMCQYVLTLSFLLIFDFVFDYTRCRKAVIRMIQEVGDSHLIVVGFDTSRIAISIRVMSYHFLAHLRTQLFVVQLLRDVLRRWWATLRKGRTLVRSGLTSILARQLSLCQSSFIKLSSTRLPGAVRIVKAVSSPSFGVKLCPCVLSASTRLK